MAQESLKSRLDEVEKTIKEEFPKFATKVEVESLRSEMMSEDKLKLVFVNALNDRFPTPAQDIEKKKINADIIKSILERLAYIIGSGGVVAIIAALLNSAKG